MKHIASAVLAEEISWGHVRLPRSECRDPRSFIKYLSFVGDREPFVHHSLLLLKITWISKSTFIPQNSSQTLTTMLETLSALWNLPVQEFLVTGYSQAFQLLCFLVRMDFFIYGHWFRWTFIYMVFIFMDIQQSYSSADSQDSILSQKHIWKLAKTYAPSCHVKLTN